METKDKKPKKSAKKLLKFVDKTQNKISRTGLAMRKLTGTGEILDMRAVLK